jgi:hypothetical protein
MKNILFIGLGVLAASLVPATLLAEDPAAPASSTTESSAGTRYGLFDWLDHRSVYGQYVFPEPFLVDDSDLEVNEARLDWRHSEGSGQRSDLVKTEVEKGFGMLTLELEIPYERDISEGRVSQGIGNIDVGARYPFYQFVSEHGFIDSTIGAGLEAGIPVSSVISKNAEFVPKIFDDLKVGNHFTLQSIAGYSTLLGGGEEGGLQTFEYGFVFGWTLHRKELPLPDVQQFIPMLELIGETELNKADPGHNSLLGNAGFRVDLKTIGRVQPRLGLGFLFPIDQGARQDPHWGVMTSLVFEY